MNIYDLVTTEELLNIPDDPKQAFGYLARISQTRVREQLGKLDPSDSEDSDQYLEIRIGFAKTLVGFAQAYDLNPLATRYETLGLSDDGAPRKLYDELTNFERDLPAFLARLEIENVRNQSQNLISVSGNFKQKINSYLNNIKNLVEKTELPVRQKEILLSHLRKFELALEKKTLNIADAGLFFIRVLELTASFSVIADSDSIRNLTHNIAVEVSKAATENADNRVLALTQPQLFLPRPEDLEACPIPKDSELPS